MFRALRIRREAVRGAWAGGRGLPSVLFDLDRQKRGPSKESYRLPATIALKQEDGIPMNSGAIGSRSSETLARKP